MSENLSRKNSAFSESGSYQARYDAKYIISNYDARDVVRGILGQPVKSRGKYDRYFAPDRDDGNRPGLTVYADGIKDYGGGDDRYWTVIDFVMERLNLDYKSACDYITGNSDILPEPHPAHDRKPSEPPSSAWQAAVMPYLVQWEENLQNAPDILDYLHNRGLSDETIKRFRVGYNPDWTQIRCEGEQLPAAPGITIPWIAHGQLYAVRVRVFGDEFDGDKYRNVTGSKPSAGMFNADSIEAGQPVFAFEGEFDCMLASQYGIKAVTRGSTSGYHNISKQWIDCLQSASVVYGSLDNDEAGQRATDAFDKQIPNFIPLQLPEGKDLTDYATSGGDVVTLFQNLPVDYKKYKARKSYKQEIARIRSQVDSRAVVQSITFSRYFRLFSLTAITRSILETASDDDDLPIAVSEWMFSKGHYESWFEQDEVPMWWISAIATASSYDQTPLIMIRLHRAFMRGDIRSHVFMGNDIVEIGQTSKPTARKVLHELISWQLVKELSVEEIPESLHSNLFPIKRGPRPKLFRISTNDMKFKMLEVISRVEHEKAFKEIIQPFKGEYTLSFDLDMPEKRTFKNIVDTAQSTQLKQLIAQIKDDYAQGHISESDHYKMLNGIQHAKRNVEKELLGNDDDWQGWDAVLDSPDTVQIGDDWTTSKELRVHLLRGYLEEHEDTNYRSFLCRLLACSDGNLHNIYKAAGITTKQTPEHFTIQRPANIDNAIRKVNKSHRVKVMNMTLNTKTGSSIPLDVLNEAWRKDYDFYEHEIVSIDLFASGARQQIVNDLPDTETEADESEQDSKPAPKRPAQPKTHEQHVGPTYSPKHILNQLRMILKVTTGYQLANIEPIVTLTEVDEPPPLRVLTGYRVDVVNDAGEVIDHADSLTELARLIIKFKGAEHERN